MINVEVMKEITELCAKYEKRWNKPVDFVGLPSTLYQERFLLIMRYIVDTGDSILVGYQKVDGLLNSYYEYLDSIDCIKDRECVDKNCPLCGKKVRLFETSNSCEFRCDTNNCVVYGVQGT